jgi:hypothetical protein
MSTPKADKLTTTPNLNQRQAAANTGHHSPCLVGDAPAAGRRRH